MQHKEHAKIGKMEQECEKVGSKEQQVQKVVSWIVENGVDVEEVVEELRRLGIGKGGLSCLTSSDSENVGKDEPKLEEVKDVKDSEIKYDRSKVLRIFGIGKIKEENYAEHGAPRFEHLEKSCFQKVHYEDEDDDEKYKYSTKKMLLVFLTYKKEILGTLKEFNVEDAKDWYVFVERILGKTIKIISSFKIFAKEVGNEEKLHVMLFIEYEFMFKYDNFMKRIVDNKGYRERFPNAKTRPRLMYYCTNGEIAESMMMEEVKKKGFEFVCRWEGA